MNVELILLAVFIPPLVMGVFSLIQKLQRKKEETTSNKQFDIVIPNVVLLIGTLCALMSIAVISGFTFFSIEKPHLIFYLIFGFFLWLGAYLILRTLTFKVSVKDKEIVVFSAFKKPYAFTFDEITSVIRQVKKNQINSERIIIKTFSGKKLIVESSCISYKRFLQRITSEVNRDRLIGFM